MEGYDCLSRNVLSPRRNHDSVSDATISGGRLLHNRAPATANDRSPTVEHCDWRTSSWSVSDDCSLQTSSGQHVRQTALICSQAVRRTIDDCCQLELHAPGPSASVSDVTKISFTAMSAYRALQLFWYPNWSYQNIWISVFYVPMLFLP